jgi:hypothetical protein
MPETNGHRDNESRLDRIKAAMEPMVGEHGMFRAEHKMHPDALIDVVDRNSREFHERLNRLEGAN